ncbi:MAG: signal peptide peptidase SppA, partial [Bacteroidetes bacterium]|nr:signal peptide peptidase SppA [Bacteroidota bacterium]
IAVVYAEGTIVLGEGDESSIGGEKFMKLIRKLRKDDKIKAIVLRVNSGGGVAFSSDKIWRELELAKEAKPLVVSMGNYAASGGYLISCGADKIYAEKNTITGSIGVVGILLNLEEFFENKLGVTFDKESIGQYADYGSLTHEWSDREHEVAQGMVKKIYGEFKQKVADGRGISTDSVEVIARGRVWTGQDALEIGLVDEIGGLDDALAYAAEKANLENYKLKEYPQEKDFFEQLMEGLMKSRTDKMLKKELGIFYSEFEMLRELEEWSGYQMRIPFDLTID